MLVIAAGVLSTGTITGRTSAALAEALGILAFVLGMLILFG